MAEIKYEHLILFCYYWSFIEHEEDHCVKATEGTRSSKEFGRCLKAIQVGQKLDNNKTYMYRSLVSNIKQQPPLGNQIEDRNL